MENLARPQSFISVIAFTVAALGVPIKYKYILRSHIYFVVSTMTN